MSAEYARDLFQYAQGVMPIAPIQCQPCEVKTTGLPLPAAKDDPLSSKLSAGEIEKSGKRRRQIEACATAVKEHPGCTSNELAQFYEMDRYAFARRLPEAERLGLVVRSEKLKRCSVSGKLALTWSGKRIDEEKRNENLGTSS